jgi:hypothetical protein
MIKRALPLFLSIALASANVFAAPSDEENKAKALFDEARDLVKAGKWNEACDKLAESKKLSPRMLTTCRLADCLEHVGKTASAHAGFIEAADLAKAVGDSSKQQDALGRAKQVEGKLSRIVLALPKEDGLSIKIDGNTIPPALTREKLPLDPGEHELVASAEGKTPRTVTFTVPPGPAVTNVTVAALEAAAVETKKPPPVVEDTPPPPPPIDDTKPTSGSGLKTAGFVTIGVGVVALGGGSYLGLSAKSLDKDAEALCTPRGCTPEGKTLNDDARSRGNLATVVFTIGAVAAVGGLVMVLVAPSSSSKTSASLTPWVAHTGGGLGLSGSF